jgi:hypothetical protein
MPDQRVIHSHVAHSVYGPTGPNELGYFSARPMSTTIRWHGQQPPEPPSSISEHISNAVAKIPGLPPGRRTRSTRRW